MGKELPRWPLWRDSAPPDIHVLESSPQVLRLSLEAFTDPTLGWVFLGLGPLSIAAGWWLWGQAAVIPAILLAGMGVFMIVFALYLVAVKVEWCVTAEKLTWTRNICGLKLRSSIEPSRVKDWGNQLAYRTGSGAAQWCISFRLNTETLPYPVVRLPGSFPRSALLHTGAWLALWSGRKFDKKLDNPPGPEFATG